MATDTATIRVSRETRDRLAAQARERGISLSSMLSVWAQQVDRERVFRAERDATRRDQGKATATAEERDWEETLGDGVD
jgi:hypothetical protein